MHSNKIAFTIYSIGNVVHKSIEYNSQTKMHSKCHFDRAFFTYAFSAYALGEMIYAKRTQNKKFPFAQCSSHDSLSLKYSFIFFLHLFKCVRIYAFTHYYAFPDALSHNKVDTCAAWR